MYEKRLEGCQRYIFGHALSATYSASGLVINCAAGLGFHHEVLPIQLPIDRVSLFVGCVAALYGNPIMGCGCIATQPLTQWRNQQCQQDAIWAASSHWMITLSVTSS